MTCRVLHSRAALLLALVCGFSAPAMAEDKVVSPPLKDVKAEKTWNIPAPDAQQLKAVPVPAYITNAKAFEALWKAWKLGDKVPDVDFKTELVLVLTTPQSSLNLSPTLDTNGNLVMTGYGNGDFGIKNHYVIISVKKDGVKSVNGKPFKE